MCRKEGFQARVGNTVFFDHTAVMNFGMRKHRSHKGSSYDQEDMDRFFFRMPRKTCSHLICAGHTAGDGTGCGAGEGAWITGMFFLWAWT